MTLERNTGPFSPYNPFVPRIRDWIDLSRSTFSSLSSSDVTKLYTVEWPETRKMLIAGHETAIEQERRHVRRWLRTTNAIFYGLARKLAPHRRIIFAVSFVLFFASLIAVFQRIPQREQTGSLFLQLTAAFLAMTYLLALELIDKLKFRDELQLARDLQASLIPHEMPRSGPWDIAAFNRIANTVGGDIYDFVPLDDGRMAVLFGDASGHGMAAGLVMAVAHAAFRTQLDVDPAPQSIIASLNRILCRTGGTRSFFTCCYVLLSPDGSFVATIAGHPPILKIDATGNVVARIGRGAYPLGVKTDLTWEIVEGSLSAGERLLLHSDGLPESRNHDDHEFGDQPIDRIPLWHPDNSAAELVESIIGEWQTFMAGFPTEDDVSLAVIRMR